MLINNKNKLILLLHILKKGTYQMKKILALLISLMLIFSFAACGSKTPQSKETNSVIIAIGSEPETLDPTKGWGHGNQPIIQSTLIKMTPDGTFKNDLATDYKLDDTGCTWTFTIRDDVYFTDGEKLTASDVAFTLNTAKNAQGSIDLTYMKSAVATNDTTVEVTLDEPNSIFLNTVSSIGIVPEHAYSEDYGTNPIGSGPYKFVEWKPQEQLILAANEDYYGAKANIDTLTIVFMSEDAALAAVKSGKVDVAYTSATLATPIEGYIIESVKSIDNRGLTLPVLPNEGKLTESGAPYGNNVTCNKEIRQAIAYSIDRELVADVVLNGYGRSAYSENDGMPWNNPDVAIQTDVEYAKQLLSEAGWADTDGDGILEKDGLKAEFCCIYPSGDSVRQAVAMAVAEQIKAIGINMSVEGVSWDEIMKRMFSDAVLMGWGSALPNETYYLYTSENALKDDFYNPEGYMNETTDSYLQAAINAQTPEEANKYWRLVQWDGTTGTSMKGECPWVWVVNLDHVTYVREGLSIGNQPIHPHGHGLPLLQNITEWKWTE